MTNKEVKELLVEIGKLRHEVKYKYNYYNLSLINQVGKRIEFGYIIFAHQKKYLLALKQKMMLLKNKREKKCLTVTEPVKDVSSLSAIPNQRELSTAHLIVEIKQKISV